MQLKKKRKKKWNKKIRFLCVIFDVNIAFSIYKLLQNIAVYLDAWPLTWYTYEKRFSSIHV